MDEGFILSNKFRRAVFAELVSGETDIERIAKKHHIIRNVAVRIADDLIREEIIDEGFILSNKFRRAIFAELVSGETNIERIAKKQHIIRNVAIRIADDFIREEIIEKKGNRYFLTTDGEKLAANIK